MDTNLEDDEDDLDQSEEEDSLNQDEDSRDGFKRISEGKKSSGND